MDIIKPPTDNNLEANGKNQKLIEIKGKVKYQYYINPVNGGVSIANLDKKTPFEKPHEYFYHYMMVKDVTARNINKISKMVIKTPDAEERMHKLLQFMSFLDSEISTLYNAIINGVDQFKVKEK